MTEEEKLTKFKSSIEDMIAVVERLNPVCDKTADLLQMLELATTNDGQLKLIIAMVTPRK